jgi:hypothetical protein
LIKLVADGLADAPPDPIPLDGFAERPRAGEADARPVGLVFADEERREQRTGVLDAGVIDPSKILGAQQADTFRKTSDTVLPLGTDREFLAAARAAAGENGASVLGFHPGAEPVRLRAMAVVRLIGAFRHGDYKYVV